MAQERKLVTVLFADIVGSSELTGQHDPEVVRETLDRAFTRIERVLIAHGATVEKFIGDAVMAVFGMPSAHDDDPDRAVRAAFASRDAIASLPVPGGKPLELRIGIDTGDVVAGGRAAERVLVTGEPVIAAARLQQTAAAGEILVGELTHGLTAGGVRYGPVRAVDAKGLGRVNVWSAEALATPVPESRRGVPGLRAPLIGRDKEVRLLHDAYDRIRSEKRAYLVTVFGPPGSGKSRLTEEFVSSADNSRVRFGRCLPYGEGITFYPLMQIIRADAGILPSDSKEEALGKLRSAVTASFIDNPDGEAVLQRVSVIAGLAQPDDMPVATESFAEELRWGVRRYLERRAGDEPLMLVFEDIHWAEPALLDAIEHLTEWSRAPLFLLCLARPDLREQRPTWGGGATNAAAIDLSPLSPEETRDLISQLLSLDALPETLRSEVVSRAEGNPLYVEEFLRMLIESGRIERQGHTWVAVGDLSVLEVPPTIQGVITARLDRVSVEVKQLLQRASVPGRTFSTAALAALGGSAAPAPDLLREATRRDLLIESDERAVGGGRVFRFKHVLIRDVAYSTLPKAERSRLHDRYGRWLEHTLGERSQEIVDVIGYHAEQAFASASEIGLPEAPGLGGRAFDLLRAAALKAHHRLDLLGARSLFRRAAAVGELARLPARDVAEVDGYLAFLERLTETSEESRLNVKRALEVARASGPSEVLVQLMVASAWGGGLGNAESQRLASEAMGVAREIGDHDLIAEVALQVAQNATTYDENYRILRESYDAQVASGARRWLVPTLASLGVSAANLGRFTEGFEYREEALRVARASGSRALVAEALLRLGHGLEHIGDLSRALAVARECLAIAKELAIPARELLSHMLLGLILEDLGEYDSARSHFQEVFDTAERLGLRFIRDAAATGLVRSYLHEGNIDAAERYVPAKFETTGHSIPQMEPLLLVARAQIRAARGEDARAEALLRDALAILEAEGDGYYRAETKRIYARLLIRQGRAREAREHIDWLLRYYAEPIAERRRREAEELLRQCEAIAQ